MIVYLKYNVCMVLTRKKIILIKDVYKYWVYMFMIEWKDYIIGKKF